MYVHYCALFVYIQSVQAASEEWDVDDTELAVPVSIPEAPVQIGDLKPAEVVFLTSPEEFCIQVRIIIIIIIISCYPLQGRRASTKRRHLILFLASFLTSPQLFPSSNASLWTDLLHVCLGLPLLRFPCGLQSRASFSMASFPFLNVCPIQFHFHLLICMKISISSALLRSSSFEITSSQWIFKIFRKQRLTNVCNLRL